MLRHAIFDLDGTLVDSLPGIGWSIGKALEACGVVSSPFDLKPLIGPPIRTILAAVSGIADPSALDRLEGAFRASYDSEGWRKTVLQPGTLDILRRLRTCGAELWVVTNKPLLASGMILRELACAGLFRELVCRDSRTPPFASKAEMLCNLVSREGLKREECLLIGDTLEDATAAARAGIWCALVMHGYGRWDGSLTAPEQCFLLKTWDDLLNYVKRWPSSVSEKAVGEPA